MVEARSRFLADRDKQWRHFIAAMVAHLVNVSGKSLETTVTAADLLGPDAQDEALRAQARRLKELKEKENPS